MPDHKIDIMDVLKAEADLIFRREGSCRKGDR